MAKTNYPEELIALVDEYLTDGIITAKEREVLKKKAASLNVDVDEFDLYIDAQQQKADQQTDASVRKAKGKTRPFCGAPIPQLADKCPECGQTITPEASEELKEIVNNLEEALVDFKSGNDVAKSKAIVERYARKAKLYYENNPKVQKLLTEIETESIKVEQTEKSKARKKSTYTKIFLGAGALPILIGFCLIFLFDDPIWGCPPSDIYLAFDEITSRLIFGIILILVGVCVLITYALNRKK